MSDDERPLLTNSGITDPGLDEPEQPGAGTVSGTGSTPFGITGPSSFAGTATCGDAKSSGLACSGTIAVTAAAPAHDRVTRIETACPGVFVDLDEASRDVAIQALAQSDAPIGDADDLVAIVTGPALKAVVLARVEQVAKHGHTPARDADLPIKHLPHHARSMIIDTVDLLEGPHRNLVVARRRLAKAAAMLMAAVDRVDIEIAKGE